MCFSKKKRTELKEQRIQKETENKVYDDILKNLKREKKQQLKILEIKRIQDEVNKIKSSIMKYQPPIQTPPTPPTPPTPQQQHIYNSWMR